VTAQPVSPAPASRFAFTAVCCPLCGGERYRGLGVKSGSFYGKHRSAEPARVVRCRDCSLIYANPMPLPRDAGASALYDESYTQMLYSERTPDGAPLRYADLPRSDIDIVEGHRRLAQLERMLGGPSLLLDVGCGGGTLLCVARERGWRAIGLEINEASARVARALNGVEVETGSIAERCSGWRGRFAAVHFNQVLEHVSDPLTFLRAIRSVLRDGGAFFCGVPNEDSAMNRLAQWYLKARGSEFTQMLSPTFPPYHVLGFSPRTVRAALERTGFRVARIEPVNYGGIDWTALREGKLLKAANSAVAALGRPFGFGHGLDVYGTAVPPGADR
jgi:2-polyprenyl-3-methyl-5-hydroxy-6-metoxy-1,4-benzoquinol methylase